MAKLMVALNQSLDGYIDHDAPGIAPDAVLFRHWIDHVRSLAGSLYGRRMYEIMRYFDDEQPEWSAEHREFAAAWREKPKWVVSRSLTSVGPNATLVQDNIEDTIRRLKNEIVGDIQVGGPELAAGLADAGLIDEYRIYLLPVVVGKGKPFFAGPLPPLRLVANDMIGNAIRLTYVPA